MAKFHSSKIFINHSNGLCDFLWANMSSDGSVIIGFSERGNETTHAIFDKERGELRPNDFKESVPIPNPKITFHPTGKYKLTTRIGLTEDSVDRCTVLGTPFINIIEPILLMEVLIPNKLRISTKQMGERDISLDASKFPQKPWRCSIFCMPKEHFYQVVEKKLPFMSTSGIEATHALESDNLCFSFTLRVSQKDKIFPDKYYFFIPGEIKWGNRSGISNHTV